MFIIITFLLLLLNYSKLKQKDFRMAVVAIILILFVLFIDLFHDIRSKQYSTHILIILTDIFEIVFAIALFYFSFQKIDKENYLLVWKTSENIRRCSLILVIIRVIKSFLQNQRFDKKINPDLPQ
jgi:hypothetical protein